MSGSTYVSDPRVWKTFYKNMLDGKFNPDGFRKKQVGSGIAGMYSKKPYMIPVNPNLSEEEPKEVIGKQVSPMTAVEDRAKSELKEEMRDNVPHVPLGTIKAENKQNTVIPYRESKKKKLQQSSRKRTAQQTRKRKAIDKNLESNIFTAREKRKRRE